MNPQINQFDLFYVDQKGRKWYSEKWVIETLGPQELDNLKLDEGLVKGLTHIDMQRVYAYPTVYTKIEKFFAEPLINAVREERAREREKKKRQTSKYKVVYDTDGYVLAYILKGLHQNQKRLVVAHCKHPDTHFNYHRHAIVEKPITCERVSQRKLLFQMLREYCDERYELEPYHDSGLHQIECLLGRKIGCDKNKKKTTDDEYRYYVDPEKFDVGEMQRFVVVKSEELLKTKDGDGREVRDNNGAKCGLQSGRQEDKGGAVSGGGGGEHRKHVCRTV